MSMAENVPPPNEKWIDELVHQLRVKHPPPAPPPAVQVGITKVQAATILIAILSPLFTGYFMASYWRGEDAKEKRFESIEREQKISRDERAMLTNTVNRIDKERTARISEVDAWRTKVEDELRIYRIAYDQFQLMKGTVQEIGKKLADGREERLRDRETDRAAGQVNRDMIMKAVTDLNTEVALLRYSVEKGGAARRGNEASPFGGENQMWTPPLLRPERAPDPLIQRATLFQPPARAARAGPYRTRGRARSGRGVFLTELTRTVERAWGRPHTRRRTWP